jgi:hypothetical protein
MSARMVTARMNGRIVASVGPSAMIERMAQILRQLEGQVAIRTKR